MIQAESNLQVADNSGARLISCIKVIGGSKRRYARIGDIIIVSVKDAIPRSKVKKGEVQRAIIVRTKKPLIREDGTSIKFDTNAAVLLDKQNEPIGTRIFGPVTRELRKKKYDEDCKLSSRGALMIKKYKKGDEVIVKVGKDKGKIGKIAKVFNSTDKVIISGVNVSKKHQKPSQDSKGGIVNKEMPVHISNILAYDSKAKKSSKVGFKVEDGKKVRILKSSGEKY